MALSDRWTRAQIVTAARRELQDPSARWWPDAELNNYAGQWQNRVQDEFELVWGTASTVVGSNTSTVTLTAVATDVLRPDAIYWDNRRLTYLPEEVLNYWLREWRGARPVTPYVVYQVNVDTVVLWPPPSQIGTALFWYPRALTLATDTSTMSLPAWTRYSALDYVAFRALLRPGPASNADRADRYKARFGKHFGLIQKMRAGYLMKRPMMLVPAETYGRDLAEPTLQITDVNMPGPILREEHVDQVPSGAINGANVTFTLTDTPSPAISLSLFLDGVRLMKDTHYTLVGATITMTTAPATGQDLFAHYLKAVT